MGEGLWKVSHQPFRLCIVFFGQKPEIVSKRQESLKQLLCFLATTLKNIGIDQPKRAGEKCAFSCRQAIHALRAMVGIALDQSIAKQFFLNGLHRSLDARIMRRKKTDQRDHQQAGIDLSRSIILRKGVARRIEPLVAYVLMDLLSNPFPAGCIAGKME